MTILNRLRTRGLLPILLGLALVAPPKAIADATLTIVNNDGAGEGFNDATAVAPVGGNPGVTRGQQRLNIFQQAATIWGMTLTSNVVILVRAQFNPQACDASSAVLGSAGPVTVHGNFANAPFLDTWFHQALANRLSGGDLSVTQPDINATFNSQLDTGLCLGGLTWYYGYDGNEGNLIELLPVVLHEMGHGLGFSTTTSGATGNFLSGLPHVYDRFLFDNTLGLHWYEMTAAQRQASAINTGNLVWDGPNAMAAAAEYLNGRPRLVINSPGGIAGNYMAVGAQFGAAPTPAGVNGNIVLVDDGTAPNINDGCEVLTPASAAAVNGNIALIDRGNCVFVQKAQNAFAAGAIGIIIANNVAGLPPDPMGGTDPSITIPVIGISLADGNTIKANLGGGVNGTITTDPFQLSGTDAAGRPLMYAPNPFQGGSSVSHWDVTLTPNAQMEPFINADDHNLLDITPGHFRDIGWWPEVTGIALARFSAEDHGDGILLRWLFTDPSDVATITIERATAADGPFGPIQTEIGVDRGITTALDLGAEVGPTYHYRLKISDRSGHIGFYGATSASRAGLTAMFLRSPAPNPTSEGTTVSFRIGRPEFVRLSVVDVNGRKVRTIHEGMLLPGEHTRTWDGRTDRSGDASPGMYFITLGTSAGVTTQRVAVMN